MPIEFIKNNVASTVLPNKSAKPEALDNKNPTAVAASSKDDTVSITAMTQGIKQSSELESSESLVNEARVAKLKAAIQDGSYVVDHQRLAKKMLQFEFNIPDTT